MTVRGGSRGARYNDAPWPATERVSRGARRFFGGRGKRPRNRRRRPRMHVCRIACCWVRHRVPVYGVATLHLTVVRFTTRNVSRLMR